MSEPFISLRNVRKVYRSGGGEFLAVSDVTMDVQEGELVSLLAASGAMAETIPPSIVLIIIGSVTGVSIAALFTGGLMPALVLAVFVAVVIWWRARGDDMSSIVRATPGWTAPWRSRSCARWRAAPR